MRCSRALFDLTAAAVVLCGLLYASPLHAAKYDYDPSADFTEYESFKLMSETPGAGGARGRGPGAGGQQGRRGAASPLMAGQIEEAIRAELIEKGLEHTTDGPADLLVAFHTGKQREVVGYGWGPRYRGPRRVAVYEEGTLTIDLVDREARELVWRGSIAATLKDDPEKLHQQIAKLVEKVLENFPPPEK
jgi:hypothetical protein